MRTGTARVLYIGIYRYDEIVEQSADNARTSNSLTSVRPLFDLSLSLRI